MRFSKIEKVLEEVLPGAVFKIQAPKENGDGEKLTRYIVWTPMAERYVYADGVPFEKVQQCVVTVATQNDEDDLTRKTVDALRAARIATSQPNFSYDDKEATYYVDIGCEVV